MRYVIFEGETMSEESILLESKDRDFAVRTFERDGYEWHLRHLGETKTEKAQEARPCLVAVEGDTIDHIIAIA